MCNAVYFANAFDWTERKFFPLRPGVTVGEWLKETGFDERMRRAPIVPILNGDELCEKDFDRAIKQDDLLALWLLPEASAAAAFFAFVAQNWIYIQFVITVALYLSMPEPALPDTADVKEGSPTYSLSARGNRARLGAPKPVVYGNMRVFPDLAAQPYSDFENLRDQYLYQLFEVTQGECSIDTNTIRFEDTPLSSFDNAEVEVIPPGQTSNLFPSAVDVSSEVQNIELLDTPVGPYTVVGAGDRAVRVSWDVVAPQGIYEQSRSTGDIRNYRVGLQFEVREIDDIDNPVGIWGVVATRTLAGSSADPLRVTVQAAVTPGRYETRVSRATPKDDSLYVRDTVNWVQVKAFLEDTTGVTTTTRIAIKVRASEQIGNRALQRMSLVCERHLPTWDSQSGWSGPAATANPAWVFADICRASYGGKRSDARIGLTGLEALAAQYTAEGITFNGVFDTAGNVWEALTKVCQVGRAAPVDSGGIYHMVRDTLNPAPVMMFTQRNIVRDSFSISCTGVLDETADAVRVIYFDESQDYRQNKVLCALPGSPAATPRDVNFFGVTNHDQAYNLGLGLAAENQYRRTNITFDAAMDGILPFYGDTVAVSHFLVGREKAEQVSGEVRSFDGVDVLVLTERVDHISNPYIVLKGLDGQPTDPLQVQVVTDNSVRIVDVFDPAPLVFERGYDRPHFMLGEGVDYFGLIKLRKIEPLDDGRYRLSGFVDAPEVYTAADGLDPPPIDTIPPPNQVVPLVTDLSAALLGTVEQPEVVLTWTGKNADYYEVEFSPDGGNTWIPFAQKPVQPYFSDFPEPGVVQYRVAGVNVLRGNWATVVVDTSDVGFTPPPPVTNLQLREAFTGLYLKLQWDSPTETNRVVFKKSGAELYAVNVTGLQYDLPASIAVEQGLGRAFDVEVYAVGLNGKISTTPATLGVSNPAPAVPNNLSVNQVGVSAIITFDYPADVDVVGISVWASNTDGFTPSAANLAIDRRPDPVLEIPLQEEVTSYIRVAAVDAWGNSPAELNLSSQYAATGGSLGVDLEAIDVTEPLVDLPSIAGQFSIVDDEISSLSATDGNLQSQIDVNAIAIVDGDNALAQQMSTLETEVDGFSASITDIEQSLNGQAAMKAVYIDNNGVIAGYKLVSEIVEDEGVVSTMAFAVDNFQIQKSGYANQVVFGVDTTLNRIGVRGDLLVSGSVTAQALSVANLSAISADLGLATAGTFRTAGSGYRAEISSSGDFPIWVGSGAKNLANAVLALDKNTNTMTYRGQLDVKSAPTGQRLEITDNVIRVYDASGVLRVKIGDLS